VIVEKLYVPDDGHSRPKHIVTMHRYSVSILNCVDGTAVNEHCCFTLISSTSVYIPHESPDDGRSGPKHVVSGTVCLCDGNLSSFIYNHCLDYAFISLCKGPIFCRAKLA
jgi:hypothetical protein